MIIRLDPFLTKLENLTYVHYNCDCIEKILFVTLYGKEEMEKYIIIEPATAREYHKITTALAQHQTPRAA